MTESEHNDIDISSSIADLSQQNISSEEKIRKLLNLNFSASDVPKIKEFINEWTTQAIECNDELYNIAILNDQIKGFGTSDVIDKRHNELIEALMSRMEGVFKMYENVDLNSQVNQIGGQVEEYNPPVAAVTLPNAASMQYTDPMHGLVAADVKEPQIAVSATSFNPGEVYADSSAVMGASAQAAAPVMPVAEATTGDQDHPVLMAPTINPATAQSLIDIGQRAHKAVDELHAYINGDQAVKEVIDGKYGALNAAMEAPAEEAAVNELSPEQEAAVFGDTTAEETKEVEEVPVGEPFTVPEVSNLHEVEVAEEQDGKEVEVPTDGAHDEPIEATDDDDLDEAIRHIREHHDQMEEIEIRILRNEKKLAEYEGMVADIRQGLDADKEELERLRKS